MKFFSGAKDRKTRALSKKNRVSSVSDSCRTEVIPAYLSRQGLSPAQLGGMHSAWNILFHFTLPYCPHGLPSEWYPLAPSFLVLYTGVPKQRHQHQHHLCKHAGNTNP